MFKTDILFTGFYGQMNTGDDAFVEVASYGAKKYWEINNTRFLGVQNRLPETMVKSYGYPFSIPKTYEMQRNLLLNNTKALISAGGSTIHSKMNSNNIKLRALARKQKHNDLKIGAIGVSIGPFKMSEDERAVEKYLKEIDFIAVRDQASFDYVNSLDLPYKPINAFDLAALLPDIYRHDQKLKSINAKKKIGISICPYESIQPGFDPAKENRRNSMMDDLLKEIDRSSNVHFVFFVINGNTQIGDLKLTMETINKVNPKSYEVVAYSRSTKYIWESIANCDFIISTRLHAAIFSCFANTPFMLNEYHRKCSDFLDNIEFDQQYRMYDSDYVVKDKARQVLDIIQNNDIYKFPARVTEMKKKAELNFTQINL